MHASSDPDWKWKRRDEQEQPLIAMAKGLASIVVVVVAVQSLAAQAPDVLQLDMRFFNKWLSEQLSELSIDEITEADSMDMVVVRTSRIGADGRLGPDVVFKCGRGSSGPEVLAFPDTALKTEERWAAPAGTCDALLAAARRRKDAQGR
jgi:hypothetical protein